jgi:hypothetical protein
MQTSVDGYSSKWIYDGKDQYVAVASGRIDGTWEEVMANAHLIAAAPDLLAALRTAEAALADIGDADREPGDDVEWCERRAAEALPLVRAAIAKAKSHEK